ncbi:hypothetical protein GPX89_36945 [Nocardia sp. ET3-3]|uniref:Uncharacterized protein n=1 Tax=Nocardia terrae TaxID=2675851 RepID=A0A7K1V825_9NOCA|nr:hypothetical protein [Nocardia terrae]MVU82810.1 hypothetical protein [Nocardia terrae]
MSIPFTRLSALGLATGAIGLGIGALALAGSPAADAQGYVPCEQWQAMHPGWPCIDVPTPPPGGPPTISTPPPLPSQTPGVPSQPGGGGGIGAGALTPPSIAPGTGTPIVPIPAPPVESGEVSAPTPDPSHSPAPVAPEDPARHPHPAGDTPAPEPTDTPVPPPVLAPSPSRDEAPAAPSPAREGGDGRIPWLLLAGAGAFLAPALRLRGGSAARQLTINKPWDGGQQTFILMTDPSAPREYRFPQNIPPGGRLRKNPDGSIDVLDNAGAVVSHTKPPWAYDALGRPVRTWYDIEDDTIVQHIEPDSETVYPILADPDTVPQCTISDDGHGGTTTSSSHGDGSVFSAHDDGHGNVSTATSTPVPGSGGTIDTRIDNADGTTSDVRSVPDGNGGVTTWTRNPDGSHTVQYPDGTFYQEPAAGSDNPIHVQGQVTDTGIDSQFTDGSGNVTTATTTTTPGNTDLHTEYETPTGHASSDSQVTAGNSIITKTLDQDGVPIVTRSVPNADGTVSTHSIVAQTTDDQGNVVYLQDDGTLFTPDVGDGTSATTTVADDGTITIVSSDLSKIVLFADGSAAAFDKFGNKIDKAIDKQLQRWPQRAAQGGAAATKFLVERQLSSVLSAMENLTAQLSRGQAVMNVSTDFDAAWLAASRSASQSAAAAEALAPAASRLGLAAKVLGKSAIILAPLGMYFDIKQGVRPGQAITSGTAGVAAGILAAPAIAAGVAAAGLAAPAIVTGAAVIGVSVGVYLGTKWLYGQMPTGWQDGIDGGLRSVWSGIKGVFS